VGPERTRSGRTAEDELRARLCSGLVGEPRRYLFLGEIGLERFGAATRACCPLGEIMTTWVGS